MGPKTPLSLHPAAGDLLITKDSHHVAPFRVNVVPHPAQIRCRSYDDAWINAQLVAEMNDVDFWYAEDDALRSLRLLGHYRTQPDPQH